MIAIHLDDKGNFIGKAFQMDEEHYSRCKKISPIWEKTTHIVDESKLDTYPKELFTNLKIKQKTKK